MIKHVPFEGCGNIESWLESRKACWSILRLYQNQPLPSQNPDLVVLMGGPMSVNDDAEYPWLATEKAAIRQWFDAGVPMLGVCLGAQLIAAALGGRVRAGEKEIGWFPVHRNNSDADRGLQRLEHGESDTLTLPASFPALHWHGDHIELPAGAVSLARSEVCKHQAFMLGRRAIGLQCHLETTQESLQSIIRNCGDELAAGGAYVQSEHELIAGLQKHGETLQGLMHSMLDYLVAPA